MGPHVESPNGQHVKLDVEAFVPTASELQAKHPIGLVVEALMDENDDSSFFKDQTVENDQNEDHNIQGENNVEAEVLSKPSDENNEVSIVDSSGDQDNGKQVRNEETYENDNILISHIMKSLIESVTRSRDKSTQDKLKEVVDVEKESETDEEPTLKRYVIICLMKRKRMTKCLNREQSKKLSRKLKTLKRKLVVSSGSK